MTLLTASQHSSDDAVVAGGINRRGIIRVAVVIAGIAALIAFVDGPLAQALLRLPTDVIGIFTALGSYAKGVYLIVVALTVSVAAMLASAVTSGYRRTSLRSLSVGAGYVFAATLIALVLATVLKIAIGRARPELLAIEGPHAFFPFSTTKAFTSLPSGETMMAVAFFGASARLAMQRVGWLGAAAIFAPALVLAAGRLIVGAHYLSDVVAGMLLSLAIVAWLYGALEQRIAGKFA